MTAPKKKAAPKPAPEVADEALEETAPDTITVTIDGTEYQILADARDDFELLDDLALLDDGDISRLPAILRRLLTPQDRQAALNTLRGDNGRVSIVEGSRFVYDLLAGASPNS